MNTTISHIKMKTGDYVDIDSLMDKTGLSINEMCDLTGVNRDTLYKWRSGVQRQSHATQRLFFMIEWLYDNDLLDNFINDNLTNL